MRPRVKICGVTGEAEARLAARLGADYLGLNFYPPSPRHVETRDAARIAEAARGQRTDVKVVGVFVNRPLEEVEEISERVGLDFLQFHGDETPEELAPVADRAIRAFRVAERVAAGLVRGYGDFWGYLFDYRHPSLYGGSGESWDFSSLAALRFEKPAFIAGGLGPENVRAAVEACSPWGVDVCSGVEGKPGKKDPELLTRLFDEIAEIDTQTVSTPRP